MKAGMRAVKTLKKKMVSLREGSAGK